MLFFTNTPNLLLLGFVAFFGKIKIQDKYQNMSVTAINSIDAKKFLFGELDKKRNIYFCPIYYKTPENHLITKTPPMVTSSGLKKKKNRWYIDCDLRETELKRHRELYKKLAMVDDLCIDVTAQKSKDWFENSSIPKRAIQARYQSPMIPGWADEPAKMRIEVLIEDGDDVVDKYHRPLDPKLVVAGSKVVLLMQLCGFWVSNTFLGCHWRIIKLIANVENPENENENENENQNDDHTQHHEEEEERLREKEERLQEERLQEKERLKEEEELNRLEEEELEKLHQEQKLRKERRESKRQTRQLDERSERSTRSKRSTHSTRSHKSERSQRSEKASRDNDRAISQMIKESKSSKNSKSSKRSTRKEKSKPQESDHKEHKEHKEQEEPIIEDESDREDDRNYYSDEEKSHETPESEDRENHEDHGYYSGDSYYSEESQDSHSEDPKNPQNPKKYSDGFSDEE